MLLSGCNTNEGVNMKDSLDKQQKVRISDVRDLNAYYEPPDGFRFIFGLVVEDQEVARNGLLNVTISSKKGKLLLEKSINVKSKEFGKYTVNSNSVDKEILSYSGKIPISEFNESEVPEGLFCLGFKDSEGNQFNQICSNVKGLPPFHND